MEIFISLYIWIQFIWDRIMTVLKLSSFNNIFKVISNLTIVKYISLLRYKCGYNFGLQQAMQFYNQSLYSCTYLSFFPFHINVIKGWGIWSITIIAEQQQQPLHKTTFSKKCFLEANHIIVCTCGFRKNAFIETRQEKENTTGEWQLNGKR